MIELDRQNDSIAKEQENYIKNAQQQADSINNAMQEMLKKSKEIENKKSIN